MRKKIYLIIFFFFIYNNLYASTKEKIIENLKITNNLIFNFEQIINGKKQSGKCTIEYPKKIFCSYNLKIKKILVSNGKFLVVKNIASNQIYHYPLKKTPLEILLDKNFLINELKNSKKKNNGNKIYALSIKKENMLVDLFFDINTYDLIGWQTEDIYQNKVITSLFNLKKNQNIDKKIFKIPTIN